MAHADMLIEFAADFRRSMSNLCYGRPGSEWNEKNKESFLATKVPAFLTRVQAYVEKHEGDWIAGTNLTIADFIYWHELEKLTLFSASALDDFPRLVAFLKAFEALPAIAAYMSSPEFIHWPLFGAIAHWGGGGEDPREKFRKSA